ncbi:MAG TPA: MFS transporter [Gemmatimonadales bacterium]|nr:MFS transporter [Gemmatimonadales bacterium]
MMSSRAKALSVLTANTLAFTVCFAVWMLYGVLITYLVDRQVYAFSKTEMGWLIGIPVLSGSILRLPAGMLSDRYGGRPVYAAVMLTAAVSVYLVSFADSFWAFLLGGLAFGLAGTSFAVGIAYTSVWFPRHQQGTALGIFGMGNAGAAVTAMVAPALLGVLTRGGEELERWRLLPRTYAWALVVTTVLFWLSTFPRKPDEPVVRTLGQRLEPLRSVRVWRFGLYYFLVFGGFVALSQWLIPYYVNVYALTIVTAGLLSSVFSLPSGVIRAFGGWLSDRLGARTVMYWVLGGCTIASLLLVVPRMDIQSPGEGVMAFRAGTITDVREDAVEVDGVQYPLRPRQLGTPEREGALIWPTSISWQEPVVRPGDAVARRQLLARGVTHIYFQANIGVFTGLVFLIGLLMGIGKAAVYKHIPEYFPSDVGTVGGMVGVIGGLGGFVGPILFGYLLDATGIWTTNWMFFFVISLAALVWMHVVIRRMMAERAPEVATHMERGGAPLPLSLRVRCPVHAVEAQVRVVAVVGDDHRFVVSQCSLFPGGEGGARCEGRCVVRDQERA